jgi:hypothetical protein
MSDFEKTLDQMQAFNSDAPPLMRVALINVADTLNMGRMWFEENKVPFTATDLLAFAERAETERLRLIEAGETDDLV